MANRYEIKYKHADMPEDHIGKTTKWARDEKQAISFLCSSKPDKNGRCRTKKGARLHIIEINEV